MINEIVNNQREYFIGGNTLSYEFRRQQLTKLRKALLDNQDEIFKAFLDDYNKCKFDVLSTELSMVIAEIDYMSKHLGALIKPKRKPSNLINFPSKGYIIPEPYGVVLIMSPWNYPLQLSLSPLVGAIAAGNTAVIKPSNYAPSVALIIKKILSVFDENYVTVVLGGRDENAELLEQQFDFIFFTGGTTVGRLVMEKAAKYLTPVALELGGKSPCIIDRDADLNLAAKRLVWGKFLNAGQTCVAPDYALVDRNIIDEFTAYLFYWTDKFFYTNEKLNDNFPHIINDKHLERLKKLIDPKKVIWGGKIDGRSLEPTIMTGVTRDEAVMQEEIFGAILPILYFDDFDAEMATLKRLPKPLAFYYFGKNKKHINTVMREMSFGGGCINDTIMHLTNEHLPFGGVGNSGMGSYHGAKSFQTFSHYKSVMIKPKMEIDLKYPPYTDNKLEKITKFTNCK